MPFGKTSAGSRFGGARGEAKPKPRPGWGNREFFRLTGLFETKKGGLVGTAEWDAVAEALTAAQEAGVGLTFFVTPSTQNPKVPYTLSASPDSRAEGERAPAAAPARKTIGRKPRVVDEPDPFEEPVRDEDEEERSA